MLSTIGTLLWIIFCLKVSIEQYNHFLAQPYTIQPQPKFVWLPRLYIIWRRQGICSTFVFKVCFSCTMLLSYFLNELQNFTKLFSIVRTPLHTCQKIFKLTLSHVFLLYCIIVHLLKG